MNWSELLANALDSSDFFQKSKIAMQEDTRISFSKLTQGLGFNSRSLVSEVLSGKRLPSYKFYMRWVRYFRYSSEQSELLKCLILKNHPRFDSSVDETKIDELLASARKKLKKRKSISLPHSVSHFSHLEHWPKVYACCGNDSSFKEILKSTHLKPSILKNVLNELIEVGLIRRQGAGFSSDEGHLMLDDELHREMIQKFIRHELETAKANIDEIFLDPLQFAFGSALMIDRKRIPALKAKLRSLMEKTVQSYFDPKGDAVISLLAIMTYSLEEKKQASDKAD